MQNLIQQLSYENAFVLINLVDKNIEAMDWIFIQDVSPVLNLYVKTNKTANASKTGSKPLPSTFNSKTYDCMQCFRMVGHLSAYDSCSIEMILHQFFKLNITFTGFLGFQKPATESSVRTVWQMKGLSKMQLRFSIHGCFLTIRKGVFRYLYEALLPTL